MKSKKYSVFLTVLFLVFIFGFAIAFWLVPDRSFSEQENRYLAQLKAPTLRTLKSGQFMEDFEDYVIDQFPLRDRWIQAKAWSERALGKQENNGVYLGTDGQTLFAQYTAPTDLAKRVANVNALADNAGVPVTFALVPDKSYVWAARLPANAPLTDDGSAASEAASLCSDKVQWIDLYGLDWGDDSFYRTDHHWSTMGAALAYQVLETALTGSAVLPDGPLKLESDSFYGTTWSSAGAGWVKPDSIYTWVDGDGFTVTAYHTGAAQPGVLYDRSKLAVKDKYSMFLGGNQPLCVISSPEASGGKLLVIRDSYADSLAPFLAQDWQEVHLWDLRYNLNSLKQYIADNGIDQVLVLYSAANFASDANLFLLGL